MYKLTVIDYDTLETTTATLPQGKLPEHIGEFASSHKNFGQAYFKTTQLIFVLERA